MTVKIVVRPLCSMGGICNVMQCKTALLLLLAVSSQSAGQHDMVEVLSSSEEDAASMNQDVSEQVCFGTVQLPQICNSCRALEAPL